jgi:transposase
MVNDHEVRLLMETLSQGKTLAAAAAKAGISENTARKWRDLGKLPSEESNERTWRTRQDPFGDSWEEILEMLEANPGLEARTIFEYLQRKYPGTYADGQLRTLQRRLKVWRATDGPPREVYFPQEHVPGELSESDFTHMNKLGITVAGQPFDHVLYHFVLTYSNWEHATICFSENFQALSVGFQNAIWELGGVPARHRTDRMSTAVHNDARNPEEFTRHYNALLSHYGIEGFKIQAGQPNENGDIEQAHHRLKKALDQSLMLRGSRDFTCVDEYRAFLNEVLDQLNAGRRQRLDEEQHVLRRLPERRLESAEKEKPRVGPSSTIRVKHNTYSVDSRLVGETVEARIHMDHIEVWYAQKKVDSFPRLRGSGKHSVNYRHVIDRLVRKPGAFANYRYKEDLFPTIRFRMAYDQLKIKKGARAEREYLKILHLASSESESGVDAALILLFDFASEIDFETVRGLVAAGIEMPEAKDVRIDDVDLSAYDQLLLPEVIS